MPKGVSGASWIRARSTYVYNNKVTTPLLLVQQRMMYFTNSCIPNEINKYACEIMPMSPRATEATEGSSDVKVGKAFSF